MFKKRQLELQILQVRLRNEKLKQSRIMLEFLPSYQLPVTITQENGRWVCGYYCHDDDMQNAVAYGDSPQQACMNFDQLWLGNVPILSDHYDDNNEEEEF